MLFFINVSEDCTSRHQCYSSDDITQQKLLTSFSIESSFLPTHSQTFICCACHFSHFSPKEKERENANNCIFRTHEGWSVLWHLSSLMTRDKITQELVSCPPHEEKCHTRSSCAIFSKFANTLCKGKKHLSSDTDGRLHVMVMTSEMKHTSF